MKKQRHFLDLDALLPEELQQILDRAEALKTSKDQPLKGRVLACIFEKPSTRTRFSFEVAMRQLGGDVVTASPIDMHLGRGEPISDTAKVLSRYVDGIMIRARKEATLLELAEHATVPVINGLTDRTHPCQLMADVLTLKQHFGVVSNLKVAWLGDGNNMATSWIHAATMFGFSLAIAAPKDYAPPSDVLAWAKKLGASIMVTEDPAEATENADCVTTDVWVSMGDEEESEARLQSLRPYQVNKKLMDHAKPSAIFLHCLPAERGKEVTAEVIDGSNSKVWDEAENRLHAQKAILEWCLAG